MSSLPLTEVIGRNVARPDLVDLSQLTAAANGVRSVGLNQINDIKREWFEDEAAWFMFAQRLDLLKQL